MRKKLKVLLLFNSPYQKPRGYDYKEEFADPENMYTENDVCQALKANGCEVSILGLHDALTPLFEEIAENRPDVIFNLVEVFHDKTHLEKNMAALLEMPGIPCTGASADNMFARGSFSRDPELVEGLAGRISYFVFCERRITSD